MSLTFYRRQLRTQQAKSIYDALCRQIECGDTSGGYHVEVREQSAALEDSFEAASALRLDRPDFFFLSRRYKGSLSGSQLTISFERLYSPTQIHRIRALLDRMLNRFADGTRELSAWEREKTVYERVVEYAEYKDEGEEHDHNVVGFLLKKSSVCEGFSSLLTLGLRRAGIPCITVLGKAGADSCWHSWNMAWINGSPCHLDASAETKTENGIGFFYFNLTDREICRDRVICTDGLPMCRDASLSYCDHERIHFCSPERAAQYIAEAFRRGSEIVRVKLDEESRVEESVCIGIQRAPRSAYAYRIGASQNAAVIERL
ncbi:MAG: transglutaminase domain-containing protein [Clostridiaceae bacterium]